MTLLTRTKIVPGFSFIWEIFHYCKACWNVLVTLTGAARNVSSFFISSQVIKWLIILQKRIFLKNAKRYPLFVYLIVIMSRVFETGFSSFSSTQEIFCRKLRAKFSDIIYGRPKLNNTWA